MRKIHWILAALSILAAPLATPAADAPSTKPPLESLKEANASLHRFVLDNGMVCLVKEDRSAPVAAIQIWVGTGAIHEGPWLGAGLSHFVEHMIFKGTPTRGPGEISRQIGDAGGDINAYTAQDRTVFHATLPAKNWKVGLDILADAVMNASFPEDEWKREQEVILREFAMGRDSPERELGKLFWETAYRVHPYKYPIIGYEDIFKATTRDDLAAFFKQNYTPDNMTLVIVGDFDATAVEAALRETFAGFARRARPPAVLPVEPPQIASRFVRKTGAYEVSRLLWGYHTVALSDPDTPALDVLASIVGSGLSSRLVRELKEKQKLVYGIDAWSETPKDPGLFGISATFDPAREDAVIAAIQHEIDQWSREKFTKEEIGKARRAVLVNELSSLQEMGGQAYSYASGEFYAASPLFSERYLEQAEQVDADALCAVVKKYLRPENRTVVVLAPETPAPTNAPAEKAEPALDIRKVDLPEGIPLIVREDHRLPFVYVCAALRGGLLSETEKDNGITQLMSDLLTRGTRKRSSQEIAKTVENLGGYLSPFCGRNSFGLQARCLASDIDTFMELFSDCLMNPAFPDDEVEKQREIQLASIRQQREQPTFIAEEALRTMLFPGHPYRWTPLGSRETVERLSHKDLSDYHRRALGAGNLVLSIFGDISAEDATKLAERYFKKFPNQPVDFPSHHPLPAPALPAHTKSREPRQQTILMVGYPGVDLKDPRMDALAVLGNALNGLSSDLGIEVRDKRGLVYFIGAFNRPGLEPGVFALYAGTREEAVGEVEQLIDKELTRLSTDGLREEEWQRAREQLITDFEMSLQNNAGLAQTCALNELYRLGYAYGLNIEERLNALSREAVRDAAASLLKEDKRAVSLVLPAKPEEGRTDTPSEEKE